MSGNKYRKLYYYLFLAPFPYREIISYGGIQSNAMLSIAAMAKEKNIPFTYYTRYIPNISLAIQSNYAQALALGMQIEVVESDSDEALGSLLRERIDPQTQLLIAQGGAGSFAREGMVRLAREIIDFKQDQGIEDLVVVTPSGTGTTAVWLDELLFDEGIEVLTTAVVGDANYLHKQMLRQRPNHHVTILTTHKKYRFAKPDSDLLKHYNDFLEKGIAFDLIYAPVMWQALQENQHYWSHKTVLYTHSGGILGNQSQLQRYKERGLSD